MTLDELRKTFPDEAACRAHLEKLIWHKGRICPHCGGEKSWAIKGKSVRPGLYQCAECRRQFTVTTKTIMHSTKLPLWKWIMAFYYILDSSKGVSSLYIGRWIGVSQKSAWKMCHGIRELMHIQHEEEPVLDGTVEIDEKYVGGKPRHENGVVHKRGKGTDKQPVLVMATRTGKIRARLIDSDSKEAIAPLVKQHVHRDSCLMTDQHKVYPAIAVDYAGHEYVNHGEKEFCRGNVHNNTAESFNAILERMKFGVFHRLSKKHLQRYVNEAIFRWEHRVPEKRRNGKMVMVPMHFLSKLRSVLRDAIWRQTRRTYNGGFRSCSNYMCCLAY